MSWKAYVQTSLKGIDGQDDSYIAGIYNTDGVPYAEHPEALSFPKEQIAKLGVIITTGGKELEAVQQTGFELNGIKYTYVKNEEKMICLQRKKVDKDLTQKEKTPLCVYRAHNCIILRMSKLGADAARENMVRVGFVGDYLDEHQETS